VDPGSHSNQVYADCVDLSAVENASKQKGWSGPPLQAKNLFPSSELRRSNAIDAVAGRWIMNMRALGIGLIFSAVALPCSAQTVLKSEPLVLAPYEVAFVQDASCPAGKVLKVTGAIRGLHRRKTCVTLAAEQASLAVATP
jgi:hypothetical protein